MPEWLEAWLVPFVVIATIGAAVTALKFWLTPLFKMKKEIDESRNKLSLLEGRVDKDYKARLRNENLQKAQAKALIALLNNCIAEESAESMKTVRDQLQYSLLEYI